VIQSVVIMVDRNVLAHQLSTGVSRQHLACLVEEVADPWQAMVEGRRHKARGEARKREAGAGARHRLVFVDRLVVTLIHLRHDLPHSVLALLSGVDRSTVTHAIGEIRGLLAERGCAVPDHPGLRLLTLADVFVYAQAEGIELRLDATEIQVRRPAAGRGGRRAFVSGKKKENTMKATVIADHQGRTLWTDALRPGRMHDATATRNDGIGTCFQHFPTWKCSWMTATSVSGVTTPAGRSHRPENRTRSLCRTYTQPEKRPGTDTHRSASPSSTRSPTTNAGSS
jgi:hypothetical protein